MKGERMRAGKGDLFCALCASQPHSQGCRRAPGTPRPRTARDARPSCPQFPRRWRRPCGAGDQAGVKGMRGGWGDQRSRGSNGRGQICAALPLLSPAPWQGLTCPACPTWRLWGRTGGEGPWGPNYDCPCAGDSLGQLAQLGGCVNGPRRVKKFHLDRLGGGGGGERQRQAGHGVPNRRLCWPSGDLSKV